MAVIHILFKIQSHCYWIEAEWGAGDILGCFGDILSFVGTIVWGVLQWLKLKRKTCLIVNYLILKKIE